MEKNMSGLRHLFVTIFLYFFGAFTVLPSITDVIMLAICPGQDECSFAIYLTGFQQVVIGVGMVVMTPLIGNLSDKYGRKYFLTIPLTLNIIPQVILAYSRTTNFFYAYYVMRTLTGMITDGSINCLALAYVADNIGDEGRASAFGILSGVISAAWVCGTFAARLISTDSTFQVAAMTSMVATVYMRIFLEESLPDFDDHDACDNNSLTHPILKARADVEKHGETLQKSRVMKKLPTLGDLICLLKSSKTFSQAAIVSFFSSLADGGFQASLMYFLKARFHFNKDQFADLMLISGIAGAVSQLILMPLLVPIFGEEKLLSLGLLMGSLHILVYSISWSSWVPYIISGASLFAMFAFPTVRSIASKQVGSDEQGKAQGCISGISSFATIVAPLIYSPLTALFLSEEAPFYFPGFSLMCAGLAMIIAFIQSTIIKSIPLTPPSQDN